MQSALERLRSQPRPCSHAWAAPRLAAVCILEGSPDNGGVSRVAYEFGAEGVEDCLASAHSSTLAGRKAQSRLEARVETTSSSLRLSGEPTSHPLLVAFAVVAPALQRASPGTVRFHRFSRG